MLFFGFVRWVLLFGFLCPLQVSVNSDLWIITFKVLSVYSCIEYRLSLVETRATVWFIDACFCAQFSISFFHFFKKKSIINFFSTSQTKFPTRFFGASPWTKIYRDRYWHGEHFEAIENLKGLLKEIYPGENVTIAECAYRWMYHHSALKDNDAVIVGASSLGQLDMNLDYTDKPALDARIVEFFEAWWKNTSHLCPQYFR